ncbi:hypothetical protein AB0L62_17790 [Nocardia asteroides]|uniref:hypothetical protein n=1 Tax=Nocardia asteroides TaxID=1824 RepID=UPI003445E878
MIAFGFAVAIGLPLMVLFGVLVWPEPIPPERTVDAIRERLEAERRREANRRGRRRPDYY